MILYGGRLKSAAAVEKSQDAGAFAFGRERELGGDFCGGCDSGYNHLSFRYR